MSSTAEAESVLVFGTASSAAHYPIQLKNLVSTISLLAATLAGAADDKPAVLRLGGSDFLRQHTAPALAAEAGAAGLALEARFEGSLPAFDAVRSGDLDAALVLDPADRDFGDEQGSAGLTAVTVGHIAVAVVVNADHPLQSIRLDQLASIFGSGLSQVTRTWGELGLDGVWNDRAIVPMLEAGPNGMVRALFRHAVLGDRDPADVVMPVDDIAETLDEIRRGRNILAVLDLAHLPASAVRAVALQPTAESAPSEPSSEAILSGAYPLALPLRLYFPAGREARVGPFLELLRSESVRAALRRDGFLPVPADG